jgi:probable O-glycosylation ligase (exosortase A-associated)
LFTSQRKALPLNGLSVSLLFFVVWMCLTTLFAIFPAGSYDIWTTVMKTQVMALLIPLLFRTREQLTYLIWVVVLSLGYYGAKGGLFTLLTGGLYKVWGPPSSYIEDNNSLAVAIIMVIPLMRYLQVTTAHRYVRWALFGMMVSSSIAVLGSYSRGALLAVAAMLGVLWFKGRHKALFLMLGVLTIPLALYFMPEQWYQRMDTIATYQQDSSANMRLNSWGTMLNIAKDNFFGAGFDVAEKPIYDRYSPDPSFPPQVAHSIYFEAIGSHGFVGLLFYLTLLACLWRHLGAIARRTRNRPDLAWAHYYGLSMQVGIVGFVVGGAFLSLLNFDVPYYLVGITLAMGRLVEERLAADVPVVRDRRPGSDRALAPAARSSI